MGGGKALVPKMDGQVKMAAEIFGESLHFVRTGAFGAAHAEGIADDDFGHVELVDHVGEGLKIGAFVAALEGFEALSGDAERVRDGESDAAAAHVEA